MTDLKATLLRLNQNLSILQERDAKYGGNAPLDLLNQITDHQQAIDLTRQAIAGEISEAEWREAVQPLLVNIRDRSQAQPDTCGISLGDVESSIIAGGNVSNAQVAHGSNIAQANHSGQAEVNVSTFDQPGQQANTQYNAAGNINIYGNQSLRSRFEGFFTFGSREAVTPLERDFR
jgi:hypothetical protein